MKNQIRILAGLVMIAALAITYGCKDDDPTPLALSTITVGGADLNGATPPTGVATDASIEVNFSTTVDPATATSSNIKLTREYDDADVPLTITPDGAKLTITPVDKLAEGNLYVLSVGTGVMSDKGLPLTEITRNFTTAGFFALPGQAAHWSFEENGDDEFGNFNAGNEIDVAYADGRNATAGKAAQFNGTTSIMEIPGASAFLDSKDFTISFWVNPDGSNEHGNFVLGLAGKLGFQFEITGNFEWVKLTSQYDLGDGTSDSEDNFWIGDGATKDNGGWVGWTFNKDVKDAGGVGAIFKDNWTHVICTYESSTKLATMYVNGEKVKQHDFNLWPAGDKKLGITGVKYAGIASPSDILAFGYIQASAEADRSLGDGYANYDDENTSHFMGLLDDVRFFKKAINANEVSLIYNSEK